MSNSIKEIILEENFLGRIIALSEKTSAKVQRLGDMLKYSAIAEKAPSVDLYVKQPRYAGDVKAMDELDVGRIRKHPMLQRMTDNNGNQTGSFIKYVYIAESVKSKGPFDMKDFKKSDVQYEKLSTGSGDVTEGFDFDKTFGELMFISAVPVDDYLDGEKTGQLDHILVTVRSEQLNEIYTIKIKNEVSKVLKFPVFSKIKMMNPAARVFSDNSQVEVGNIQVSLTADDVELIDSVDSSKSSHDEGKVNVSKQQSKKTE